MNLQESIRRILREDRKLSVEFKRRIQKFNYFIWNNFVTQYPCDFENFTAFMQGIHTEIRDAINEFSDDDGNWSEWLTYEEAAQYVETYMIDELKNFYFEQCSYANYDDL